MGWGRMLLLGNFGQQMDIGDLEGAVQGMRDEFARNESLDSAQQRDIEQLRQENHELKLYLAMLLRLLVAKGVIQASEVETTVQAIEKN
jgi:hypothetical protein